MKNLGRFPNVALQLALWLRPSYCVTPCYEEEPPPPRSTPWGAYRSTPTFGAVYLFLQSPLCCHHSYTHSHKADRSPVVSHIPMVHTLSFMCTNHIAMMVHTLDFLQVGEHSTQTRQLVGSN